jgi:spore maturation protein CgeB
MKVLYIGQCDLGSTSRMRYEIIGNLLKSKIELIDTSLEIHGSNKIIRSIGWRYFIGPLIWRINQNIKNKVIEGNKKFELIWVDKGVFIYPNLLRKLKKNTNLLLHYTPDTAFYENNSRFFRNGLDIYDYLITTKSFEIEEYLNRVLKNKIIYLTQGYNSNIHYPRVDFNNKMESITFIGLCEPYREMVLNKLVKNGFSIVLGGYGWSSFLKKNKEFKDKITFVGELVIDEDYAQIISHSKFALGLLSKKFPETHTTRTFEIPACGTCLITEENMEINTFFEDNECIKFRDLNQLLEKLIYYSIQKHELENISNLGLQRVKKDNRNYENQIRFVLEYVQKSSVKVGIN